jgi:RNA:NAD 2'-phosphotransferase (TPT1/KptA family)
MLTKFCVNPGQQVIGERENAIIDRFCSEVLRHFQEEINECINIA